jgi:exodeoxyribonuclease VII small subunit
MSKKKNDFDIEASMNRLQNIVELLESDETKLRDAVALYEESIDLVQKCISELSTVRSHIKELKDKAEFNLNETIVED